MAAKTDTLIDESAAPDLITQGEVAALFRVSLRTVRSWRGRGILTGAKVGGTVRYKREDVLALLDNPGTQ